MKLLPASRVLAIAAAVATLLLLASWYVRQEERDMANQLRLLISEQETTLSTIAEVTDRDGADPVVEAIVKDCEPVARERFDMLLGNLSRLSLVELTEVDRLFASCGNFYTQRKAVMVARFRREYQVYAAYIDVLSRVDGRASHTQYPLIKWDELVKLEEERSKLSSELVVMQGNIITALRGGVRADSEDIATRLAQAQEVKDTLSYTSIQIDRVRGEVLGL